MCIRDRYIDSLPRMVFGAVQKLLFDKIIFFLVAILKRFLIILSCHEQLEYMGLSRIFKSKNKIVAESAATVFTIKGKWL